MVRKADRRLRRCLARDGANSKLGQVLHIYRVPGLARRINIYDIDRRRMERVAVEADQEDFAAADRLGLGEQRVLNPRRREDTVATRLGSRLRESHNLATIDDPLIAARLVASAFSSQPTEGPTFALSAVATAARRSVAMAVALGWKSYAS